MTWRGLTTLHLTMWCDFLKVMVMVMPAFVVFFGYIPSTCAYTPATIQKVAGKELPPWIWRLMPEHGQKWPSFLWDHLGRFLQALVLLKPLKVLEADFCGINSLMSHSRKCGLVLLSLWLWEVPLFILERKCEFGGKLEDMNSFRLGGFPFSLTQLPRCSGNQALIMPSACRGGSRNTNFQRIWARPVVWAGNISRFYLITSVIVTKRWLHFPYRYIGFYGTLSRSRASICIMTLWSWTDR